MIPKFRVFDSKFKEMEEVYLIDWQWPEQDAWINDNPSDNLIFMQTTGLHVKLADCVTLTVGKLRIVGQAKMTLIMTHLIFKPHVIPYG